MIKPNKLTDPQNCIVYNAYILLKFLLRRKRASYDAVLKNQIDTIGESATDLFYLVLSFLFALGLVVYTSDNDSFEVVYETK